MNQHLRTQPHENSPLGRWKFRKLFWTAHPPILSLIKAFFCLVSILLVRLTDVKAQTKYANSFASAHTRQTNIAKWPRNTDAEVALGSEVVIPQKTSGLNTAVTLEKANEVTVPTPLPLVQSITTEQTLTYASTVDFTVNFNQNVTDITSGNFSLTTTGDITGASISNVFGSGTNRIIRVNTGSGNGTIRLNVANSAGTSPTLSNVPYTSGPVVTIDKIAPYVTAVSVPADANYTTGQDLKFKVTFNEAVRPTNGQGSPFLSVKVGNQTVNAPLIDGLNTNTLTFLYTVQSDQQDNDGIELGSSIHIDCSSLRDEAGNYASQTLNNVPSTTGLRVNAVTAAQVQSIAPESGLSNAPFVYFTVTFDKDVAGLGNTNFTLSTTGAVSGASVSDVSGSGTSWVVTVNTGNGDGTLRLNLANSTGLTPTVSNAPYTNGSTLTIDKTVPYVTSVSVPANGNYTNGQDLLFKVTFSEVVHVTAGEGDPYLRITIGNESVNAPLIGGLNTKTLTFQYTVQSGQQDEDGLTLDNEVQIDCASLRDEANNYASLTLNNVPSTAGILINVANPAVNSVSVPANGNYTAGQELVFTVNFNKPVTVNGGTPSIPLTIGNSTVYANYTGGSGTSALTFRYTIQPGQQDDDGIALAAALNLNGATIRDASGTNASPTLSGVPATAGIRVDAVALFITSVSGPANGTYLNGQNLNFIVNFNKAVSVSGGSPTLNLTLGNNTRQAVYTGPYSASSLAFLYTVQCGDLDQDGIQISALNANGASINDQVNNTASPVLSNVASTAGVLVSARPDAPNLSANGPTSVLQGSPSVVLSANNCAGTLQWTGPNGSSGTGNIVVPTTGLGQFTYSATCVQNGCSSASASVTVEVNATSPTTSNCTSFAAVCSGNQQEVRTLSFSAPAEGDYEVVLAYLAAEKAVSALVRIDGMARTIGLARTRTYLNQSLGVMHLTAGRHTLQLSAAASDNYVCFNGICLTPSGSSGAPSCNFAVTASATSPTVSCGASVSLTAGCSGGDCGSVSYSWSGPGLSQSGNTAQLNAPATNGSYTYTVTASLPGCTNQSAQTTVVVSGCTPVTPPSSNSVCTTFGEVCSGNTSEVRTQSFTVASEGDYEIRLSYKSPEKATTGLVVLDGNSRTVGFSLARSYQYQSLGVIHLTAGTHTLRLSAAAGGNYICFNGVCLIGNGANTSCNFTVNSSASSNAVSCGGSVSLMAGCVGNDCAGVTYNWQGSGLDQNTASTSFTVPSANGNYTYTATASKFGCPSQTTYQIITVSGCSSGTPPTGNPTLSCSSFAEVCTGNPREVRTQTVKVDYEGDYELILSYKSPEKATKGQILINGTSRTMDLARTASYQQQTAGTIHLTAGNHVLQLSAAAADNYICFNGVCLKGAGAPPPPPRLQAGGQESGRFQVKVLGNPVLGQQIDVEVSGAEGQALKLQLTDEQGRVISERHVPQAAAVEHQRLESGASGLLLLRVRAGSQSQTLKLVKP